jgi:hypothetical protein
MSQEKNKERSPIWNHFIHAEKTSDSTHHCRHCSATYSRKSSTSTLSKHHNSAHKTIPLCDESTDEDLILFLVTTDTPFSVIENPYFQKISKIRITSRNTIANRLPRMRANLVAKIKQQLASVSFVSLTADNWSSPGGDKFFGVTAAHIDEDWNFQEYLLDVRHIKSSTSTVLSTIILDITTKFEVNGKVVGITTDAGSDILASTQVNDMFQVWCINHLISLCLKEMLTKSALSPMFQKLKRISKHFHTPIKSHELLANYEGEEFFPDDEEFHSEEDSVSSDINPLSDCDPVGESNESLDDDEVSTQPSPAVKNKIRLKVQGYCETRWLSVYPMLRSILRNLRRILFVFSHREGEDVDFMDMQLNKEEWITLKQLHTFLEEFQDIMLIFETKKASSFSEIHPTVATLTDVIENSISRCAEIEQGLNNVEIDGQINQNGFEIIDQSQNFEGSFDESFLNTPFTKFDEVKKFIMSKRKQYENLEDHLIECNEQMRNGLSVMLAGIKKRFRNRYEHKNFYIALVLNPLHRFLEYMPNKDERDQAYTLLNDEFLGWKKKNTGDTRPTKKRKRNLFKKVSKPLNFTFNFGDHELNTYFEIPPVDPTGFVTVIDWWKEHKDTLPLLSQFAKKYLVLSGSSASIERAWSQAKRITDPQRSRLSSQHFEELLFVKFNEKSFEF